MNNIDFIYIFGALIFGMLHAMEPGHGKSLVATFVLCSHSSKTRDAFLIGLIASITHTASVYLLGFISLKFMEVALPFEKDNFINLVASVIIFSIGLYLMWDRIINPLFHHEYEHKCSAHDVLSKNLKITSTLLIGLTAGFVPCSGGLAVFMTATAVSNINNQLNSFLYVLSFSIGLGLALTLVALSIIFGQGLLKTILEKSISNIEKPAGVISAILIYTLGLVLLTSNVVKCVHVENKNHYHSISTQHSAVSNQ